MAGYPEFFKTFIAYHPSDRAKLLTKENWALVASQENHPHFVSVLIGLINNHPPCVVTILLNPDWVNSFTKDWHWQCVEEALIQIHLRRDAPSDPQLLILLLNHYPPAVEKIIRKPSLLANFTQYEHFSVINQALSKINYPEQLSQRFTLFLLGKLKIAEAKQKQESDSELEENSRALFHGL